MTTGFFVGVADGEAEAVAGGDVVAAAVGEAEAVAEVEGEAEADVVAETEDAPSSPSEHPEMPRERATSPAIRAPYERRALHLFLMPSAPLDIDELGASRRDMPPPPVLVLNHCCCPACACDAVAPRGLRGREPLGAPDRSGEILGLL